MVKCPKCGKELKHEGALRGHIAFAHGETTPRKKTLDELREIVKSLQASIKGHEKTLVTVNKILNNSITKLEKRVTNVENDISDLERQIRDLEAQVRIG